MVRIGDDHIGGGNRHAGDAHLVQRGGQQRRGEALAHSGDGVQGARRKFPEQGRSLQQALEFGQHLGKALIDLCQLCGIVNQSFERFSVLAAQFADKLGGDGRVARFRAVGGIDQPIGYAAHGRDHHDDGAFRRRGFYDGRGAGDASGVSHRGAAKFHNAQGRHQARPFSCRFIDGLQRGRKRFQSRFHTHGLLLSLVLFVGLMPVLNPNIVSEPVPSNRRLYNQNRRAASEFAAFTRTIVHLFRASAAALPCLSAQLTVQ